MRGVRIHTIDADEDGDDEPKEESWFKKKEKRSGKLTKGKGVNKATGSSKAVENLEEMISAWKSGLKTAKRPQPDRTKTGKRPDHSPVFWFLRFQDRKKTGLNEPV